MAMLSLPLDAGKARLMSCSVVYSLRVFSGFVRFLLWASFGYSVYLGAPYFFQ
jgi:hypothetical protein